MPMAGMGTVFDIKELALFDGPGIRTTVFLKGCPLRCAWCHNPEGLSPLPELMVSQSGCTHCGACHRVCTHPEGCVLCGECVAACPGRLRKICGVLYSPEKLAEKLLKNADYMAAVGGGVTFSGGEPLTQSEFLMAVLEHLPSVHKAVETSGYCAPEDFREVVSRLDYVIMDIKLVDDGQHRRWTGVSNRRILENLEALKSGEKPFMIRVPLIPGVSDTEDNLMATAALLGGAKSLERVELLPYHQTAGAKYGMVGKTYEPGFDTEACPKGRAEIFTRAGIDCRVL